jgi:hypothetical protein
MPGELASTERENMKVLLDAEGDQYSWLQIMPRFKIDRSGVQITSETEVCLKVRERANEFIHCASRKLTADSDAEVNCSLESTFWYLNIFQSVKHSIDQRIVMKSELVYFSDPGEAENNLITSENYRIPSADPSFARIILLLCSAFFGIVYFYRSIHREQVCVVNTAAPRRDAGVHRSR